MRKRWHNNIFCPVLPYSHSSKFTFISKFMESDWGFVFRLDKLQRQCWHFFEYRNSWTVYSNNVTLADSEADKSGFSPLNGGRTWERGEMPHKGHDSPLNVSAREYQQLTKESKITTTKIRCNVKMDWQSDEQIDRKT